MAISPGGRPADDSGFGKPGSPRGLTDYTREIAHALLRKHPDWTESHAIAVARNAQMRFAAKSKNPNVKRAAVQSLVEQHALDHRKRG